MSKTKYHKVNGLIVPVEPPKPPERLKKWDCPHCHRPYDYDIDQGEEYTVGQLRNDIPHCVCPGCKKCMGCLDD